MTSGLREVDIVARYGGEEFVIIFPETSPENAVMLCDRIRQAIADYDWQGLCDGLSVTMSMGVCTNEKLNKFEAILSLADKNLYEAKHTGKNKVVSQCAAE